MEAIARQRGPIRRFSKNLPATIVSAWVTVFFLFVSLVAQGNAAEATFAWGVSSGATGYKIYYGTESGNYSWFVNVGNVTSYTFADLPDGYTYYLAATAYDASSESGYSNEVSFTAGTALAPSASSYTLTVVKSGTGTGTVTTSPAGTTFAAGAVVTLTATAASGSYFTGWGTPCSGNGTCTITMNSNIQITATFNPAGKLFIDVPPGYWAESYISAIYGAGYTAGYGARNYFGPDEYVTREQLSAFIVRAAEGEPPADYCSGGSPFSDCSSSSWSCKYIKRLYEMGITTGYGNTALFMPSLNITRAEMAALLVRAADGEPSFDYCLYGSAFVDVATSSWSCKYIKRLYEMGITTGYGNGRYGPDDLVTRAQVAVFLGRAFLGMD